MDWFAVASYGAYPTAGSTDAERAIFAVSYGLLDTAYEQAAGVEGGPFSMQLNLTLN